MEKTALENSKPDQNEKVTSQMKKYKTKTEYDKHLLNGPCKRERRIEAGFVLVDVPPDFSENENKWVAFKYDRQMEGWEKLCVEAYCIGWLAFYDNHNNIPNRKIYFKWEDIQTLKKEGKDEPPAEGSKVTVYIDPGPQTLAVPLSDPPQPPPPPMS